MAWKECRVEELRLEFIRLASVEGVHFTLLCRRFGVSAKTGYKWLKRFRSGGIEALSDRSRRPLSSPARLSGDMERKVIEIRRRHRSWGGRKISVVLSRQGVVSPPSPSAVTRTLHRHGLIDPRDSQQRQRPIRFERESPNDLWQMDFKGHFALGDSSRCHPLTVLDDHSRFSIVLAACDNQRTETVKEHLVAAFKRYGLPRQFLADNGSPWGTSGCRIEEQWTVLTVWLLRLGPGVIHGKPGHPQTQGKEERFHKTLWDDLLKWNAFADLPAAARGFKQYRQTYNHHRPHEALSEQPFPAMACPAMRYTVSPRSFPAVLPPIRYGPGDKVRTVAANGRIGFRNQSFAIGKAFAGQPIALRPTIQSGLWETFYCQHRIGWLDEDTGETAGPKATGPLAELIKSVQQETAAQP